MKAGFVPLKYNTVFTVIGNFAFRMKIYDILTPYQNFQIYDNSEYMYDSIPECIDRITIFGYGRESDVPEEVKLLTDFRIGDTMDKDDGEYYYNHGWIE